MTTLKIGSQGSDVSKLQEMLNRYDFKLDVDGIFGAKTEAAVREFREGEGLGIDGSVDSTVWEHMLSNAPKVNSNSVSSSTPFTYKDFSYDNFSYDGYQESDIVKQAQEALNAQMLQKPVGYESQWQTQLSDIMKKIQNREKFSYNFNEDALYQQYKDKHTQQAKMAMGDAIGQASAMTGGYGNSYAQSVGQQMYQKEMQNLNDIIPELYQMAYDKHNQEGQDLYNQYAMLNEQENMDYGRYRDKVSDWQSERDYLANRYDTERDYDYSKYVNDRNFEYDKYSSDRDLAYDKYSTDKNLAYNEHRNAIADAQWQAEFDEAQRQFEADRKMQSAQIQATKTQKTQQKKEDDDPVVEPPKYVYEETPAVNSFVARIRTRSEFARGSNSDKQKYGTYENYVKGMLEKYEGELTDNEIATISQKFGL